MEIQKNDNQDFLTLIVKILEFGYLLADKFEYRELLKNIFGACDLNNLTIIISMFYNYNENISVVESLLELVYLRNRNLLNKYLENKDQIKNIPQKKKDKAIQEDTLLKEQLQYQKEKKKKFTDQCIRLLDKINNSPKMNYALALTIRLIIDDGVFEYSEFEEKKESNAMLDGSDLIKNDNVLRSVLCKIKVSEPIMKCLLLTYCDYNREKKVNIMKNIEKFEVIECEEYFNAPFTFEKKALLLNLVYSLTGIIKTHGALFLSSAKKLYEILSQLIKIVGNNAKRTKENMCWFNHIFESRSICCTFFEAYIRKVGFPALNEFLKAITKSLVKLHSNPFIYSLYEKQIKLNLEEANRMLNHFAFKTFNIESIEPCIIDRNLEQYCLMLQTLSVSNVIPNDNFQEIVKSHVKLLIETQKIYSNVLISCPKEEKMTMIEIIIEISHTITKDDLMFVKDIIINKQSKKSILFEFDKKNDPKIRAKDKDNKIEKEDTSLVIKILDKYSNDKRWIEEKDLHDQLQQEKDEVTQKIKGLVVSVKNKKILMENTNNSNNENKPIEFDENKNIKLNESFAKCENCTLDENDTFSLSNHTLVDKQIDSGKDTKMKCQLIKNEYASNSLLGFYDVGINNAVICCKRDLILRSFAIHFLDIYFEDNQFKLIHSNFYKYITVEEELNQEKRHHNSKTKNIMQQNPIFLPIPTKIRNYSSCNYFTPRIFLKKDFDFYHSSFFPISHCYYTPFFSKFEIKTYNNLITDLDNPFKSKFFNLKTSIFECKAELITINYITCGTLYLLSNNLLFISSKNNKEFIEDRKTFEYVLSNSVNDIQQRNKEVIILLSKVEEIITRRFLYKYVAIEVFMRNGKSYFFNLHNAPNIKREKPEEKMGLLDHLLEIKSSFYKYRIITNPKQEIKNKEIIALWKKNKLTNHELLLLLNKYSGRTYNDLSQYPILPWVTLFISHDKPKMKSSKEDKDKDRRKSINEPNNDDSINKSINSSKEIQEHETKIDLTKPSSLYEKFKKHQRDFQYPISIQTPENKKRIEKKYKESLKVEAKKSHIAHFRLFYSTSGYVIFYLFRLNPFTQNQIIFQSGKFDSPGRQFNSVTGLVALLNNNLDNRELLPELFSSFEYALNINYCFYGVKPSTYELIHNIEKPSEIGSLAQLPYLQLRFLNKDQIKQTINDWIDNIFGYYQLKKHNNNRMNQFDKYNYAQLVDLDAKKKKYLQKIEIKEMTVKKAIDKLRGKADRIIAFGQAPDKLFSDIFKKWEVYDGKENTDDDFSVVGNLMGNLNVAWKDTIHKDSRVIYANLTSNRDFIYTLIITPNDVHHDTIKIFRNKNEFSKPDNISISKIKLFKIKMDDNKNCLNFILRYPAKYAIFETHNGAYFFTCRHFDNSIKVYDKNGLVSSYITDSFVITLYRLDVNGFLSGSRNGKLIHWMINYKTNSIDLLQKRSVYAHNGMLTGIVYVKKHHVLLTIGEDRNLFIRKMDTFELMTKISTKSKTEYFSDFAFSSYNQIWTLTLDNSKLHKDKKCFYLSAYSINGICFYTSDYNTYNGLCINSNGVVITSLFESASIYLYSLEWFHKKNKDLPVPLPLPCLNLEPHEINLKNIFLDSNLGNELFLSNFSYFNESNTFYLILLNRVFRIVYDNHSKEQEWFHDQELKSNVSLPKINMGF